MTESYNHSQPEYPDIATQVQKTDEEIMAELRILNTPGEGDDGAITVNYRLPDNT